MSTREELEKMSVDELEQLYNELKSQYNRTLSKNRRIHEMLIRKIESKQESIILLKTKVEELLDANPELRVWYDAISKTNNSDDNEYDPEKIQNEIKSNKETLSNLQTNQIQIQRELSEIKILLEQQKTTEIQLQKEIGNLITKGTSISGTDAGQTELLELSKLTQEYQDLQSELDEVNKEINNFKTKIQR